MRLCRFAGGLALAALALGAAVWLARSGPDPAHVHVKLVPGAHWNPHLAGRPGDEPGAQYIGPVFRRPAQELARERQALIAAGVSAPDLTAWHRIEVRAGERAARRLAEKLRADPRVDTAFVEPRAVPAALALPGPHPTESSCPVRTPSYEPYQGYLAEAPAGINAPIAWSLPGGRGERIWFADVEGGWNTAHEDVPDERMIHVGGRRVRERAWQAHGTAVVGEVASRDNGIGMVGITPEIERIFTASIGAIGPAAAIDLAQAQLRPGDVLLIELHAIGPRNRFLPVEFWDDVFDAVSLATARGVIVIAAAGNGGEDLDHPTYNGKFDLGVRDSGAILVGAGAPAKQEFSDRSRLDFSNFGERVDAQGWGRLVATLDYGDLQDCDAVDRRYTGAFGGTSSASPIVAAAAIAIQGIAQAAGRERLDPRRMRALLRDTGTPQTDGPHGPASQRIGPRPDLLRALDKLGLIGERRLIESRR